MNLIKFIIDSYKEAINDKNGNDAIAGISIVGLIVSLVLISGGFITMEIKPVLFRAFIVSSFASTIAPIWYYYKLKEKETK